MWQVHGSQHQNTPATLKIFSKVWKGPHIFSKLGQDRVCEAFHPHLKQREEDRKSEAWPRELRENQNRHWDDSCDAKSSTSDSPNRYQIWATVWRFNIHFPSLSFCLDRKLAARFKTHRTWTALKKRNSPDQTPRAGLPSKTMPQPVIDAWMSLSLTVNCTYSDSTPEKSGVSPY